MNKKIALITGANRGIGLETARQLARQGIHMLLGSRTLAKGETAAKALAQDGIEVEPFEIDVTSDANVRSAASKIRERFGRLDILVNNAGIFPDADGSAGREPISTFEMPVSKLREAMETNTYGPFRTCQALIPLMRDRGYGRIVNVSSGMGQLSEMEGGYPAYRLSKTALNALTKIFAAETADSDILVNSVCPGWVKTDMGGPMAERPVEKGAETLVWLATLPTGGPTGGFFRDRESIEW